MISKQTRLLIQEAREPIIIDDLSSINKHYHRVVIFDPSEIYNRLKGSISPFKRRNQLGMADAFPTIDKTVCACGCKVKLQGRRRRWATDECNIFAAQVVNIINGDTDVIRSIIAELYGGYKCFKCNRTDDDFPRTLELPSFKWPRTKEQQKLYDKAYNKVMHDMCSKIHLDHILPVHQGGGGCWLSNYQFLCCDDHKVKSKEERK